MTSKIEALEKQLQTKDVNISEKNSYRILQNEMNLFKIIKNNSK